MPTELKEIFTMPRPPQLLKQADTPASPDERIAALVRDFQLTPLDFFCEPDLHAHFFGQCRNAFPEHRTHEGIYLKTFHCQYETFWRYPSGDRFAERRVDCGSTATFDFVVLRKEFIERSDYLIAINKNELQRKMVRRQPGAEAFDAYAPVQFAIEIKMATFRSAKEVTEGDINRLEDRMLTACRKLAQERVRQSYVVGISHGPLPDMPRAHAMVATCLQLHRARYPDGILSVLVATPTQTILGGDWAEDIEFPKVASQGGWPVSRNEDAGSEPGPGSDSVQ
jgi:hypothetical protein